MSDKKCKLCGCVPAPIFDSKKCVYCKKETEYKVLHNSEIDDICAKITECLKCGHIGMVVSRVSDDSIIIVVDKFLDRRGCEISEKY